MFSVVNMVNLLFAPIKRTLPLADVLKVRLKLWKDIRKLLKHISIQMPIA